MEKKAQGVLNQARELFSQGNFQVVYYGETELLEENPEDLRQDKMTAGNFRLRGDKWPGILDDLMTYPEETQFSIFERSISANITGIALNWPSLPEILSIQISTGLFLSRINLQPLLIP